MEEREAAEHLIKANRIRNEAIHSNFAKYTEFVDTLNEEQLVGLNSMIAMFSSHDEPMRPLAYWRGIIDSRLFERHHLCILCTKNHDLELQTLLLMSDAERMEHFQVRGASDLIGAGLAGGSVVCIHCSSAFESMEARMKTEPGKEGCPGCLGQNFIRMRGHDDE